VFAEEDHEGNVLSAVRTEDWKLIRANDDNPRGLETVELYDMESDPAQTENRRDEAPPAVIEDLEAHLEAWRAYATGRAVEGTGEAELSKEECEQLRALGYVDSCE